MSFGLSTEKRGEEAGEGGLALTAQGQPRHFCGRVDHCKVEDVFAFLITAAPDDSLEHPQRKVSSLTLESTSLVHPLTPQGRETRLGPDLNTFAVELLQDLSR